VVTEGTILRAAATLDQKFGIYFINAGRLGFGNGSKENIDEFLQIVIEKKYTLSKENLLEAYLFSNEALQDINFAMNEISVAERTLPR
jgi:NAD+ kinase